MVLSYTLSLYYGIMQWLLYQADGSINKAINKLTVYIVNSFIASILGLSTKEAVAHKTGKGILIWSDPIIKFHEVHLFSSN